MIPILSILVIILLANLVIAYRLDWAFRHYIPKIKPLRELPEDELPTVSVCIPARNEKHAMTSCLETVISSTYPKLEIIVLDDDSKDETSLLIKSFAHAGVRFVEGTPLPSAWLGKNHALDTLLREASGQYVLFMDVDTRIEPQTVSQLVAYIRLKKAAMVSVLPRRHDGWWASVVFTTMRFFWEVLVQRRGRPAVASTAWMIKREVLSDELGGMKSYAVTTRPELEIAKQLNLKDRYRFVISGKWLGIRYEKKWTSQVETSIRLMYPWLGHSRLHVWTAVAALVIALLPYAYILIGLSTGITLVTFASLAIGILQMAIYGWYVSKVWSRGWLVGGLVLPILLAIEVWLIIASAVGYQRGTITWKGRPIVATVIQTESES